MDGIRSSLAARKMCIDGDVCSMYESLPSNVQSKIAALLSMEGKESFIRETINKLPFI